MGPIELHSSCKVSPLPAIHGQSVAPQTREKMVFACERVARMSVS